MHIPLRIADPSWGNHIAVFEIPWILSLIGLWLFLKSAKQKASIRFGGEVSRS
jgi:hypothetical protein